MEFGNLNNLIYFIFPILILIVMFLGMKQKINILKSLKLKNKNKISILKIFFVTLGGVFIVIALLSPQKEIENENIKVKGMNIYALIDTSRSMLTEDVYPNRLEVSKRVLSNLIKSLKGDRIGFIPFSDSAYIQMPLTDDYNITENYISALDTNLISGGGTELYQALELANKSFNEIGSDNKTILLLSDGGDFDEKVLNFIKENNIKVFSIGIGTNDGNVIPKYIDGIKKGFIKDDNGSAVISRLNSDFLKKISEESDGKYYEVNNLIDTSTNFYTDTLNLERKNERDEKVKTYIKFYQYPLILGLLFILISYFLKEVIKDEK